MGSLAKLIMIVTATWLLLLAETYVLFGVIRPLAPNIHESVSSAVLKVTSTAVLLVVWGAAMFFLRRVYVRSTRPRPPQESPDKRSGIREIVAEKSPVPCRGK